MDKNNKEESRKSAGASKDMKEENAPAESHVEMDSRLLTALLTVSDTNYIFI